MEKPPPIPWTNHEKAPPIIPPPVILSPVVLVGNSGVEGTQKGYKIRRKRLGERIGSLPWPVRIVILITLPAFLIFGSGAAGIAILGGAFGLPLLLLAFLGALAVIGCVTLAKSLKSSSEGRNYVASVVAQIIRDESMRMVRSQLRKAMSAEPVEPFKQTLHGDEVRLREQLLAMDPFEFERHVMGFFEDEGLFAWVTKKSNDAGVDGFARHKNGLIVVQCKRNAPHVPVGRPIVQQFKGVVEENGAFRGYIVTTSYFSDVAGESAAKNQRLCLIDMKGLVAWHRDGLDIE